MIFVREECPGDIDAIRINFSPVKIQGRSKTIKGVGLAPLAVLPAWQRQGIGTYLIKQGIDVLKSEGCPFIIVLGHREYSPRFEFESASGDNIRSQWEGVQDEAFMIRILDPAAMAGVQGVAWYRDEFNEAI